MELGLKVVLIEARDLGELAYFFSLDGEFFVGGFDTIFEPFEDDVLVSCSHLLGPVGQGVVFLLEIAE